MKRLDFYWLCSGITLVILSAVLLVLLAVLVTKGSSAALLLWPTFFFIIGIAIIVKVRVAFKEGLDKDQKKYMGYFLSGAGVFLVLASFVKAPIIVLVLGLLLFLMGVYQIASSYHKHIFHI